MGTTESSVKGFVSSELSDIIARNREHNPVPLAVGFWVATRLHFNTVVVGSRIVSLVPGRSCSQVVGKDPRDRRLLTPLLPEFKARDTTTLSSPEFLDRLE